MVLTMKRLLLAFVVLAGTLLQAQQFVKLTTVEKGKEINKPFHITFQVNGRNIEPFRFENGFVVPPELAKASFVDVKVTFKNYDLDFSSVSVKKFEGEWVVGVETRPFSAKFAKEEMIRDGKRLRFIYYLQCEPTAGDGTEQVERIYR